MALSNSQYNAIMRDYERQQAQDRRDLEDRLDKIYEKIPQMKQLNSQAGVSAVSRYRQLMAGGDATVLTGFSYEIEDIKNKKVTMLDEHGFPEDYMEMHYICTDCKDTGYIDGVKCHCFKAKTIKLLYAQSNIDRVLEKENFDTLSYEYFDDKNIISQIGMTEADYMRKVVDICRDYVENFDSKTENLLFMGNTGVGKTFLSNCIAKELIDKYYSVIYLTSNELFDCIANVKMNKDTDIDKRELYDFIIECDLLIVDDLGTELTNSFISSQLFYIVNSRLNSEKSTIISSNLSMGMLRDTYSERVTSRLTSGYNIIPLYGGDIRRKIE